MSDDDCVMTNACHEACSRTESSINGLLSLCDADDCGGDWSSRVARAQALVNDHISVCKDRLFDVTVAAEEAEASVAAALSCQQRELEARIGALEASFSAAKARAAAATARAFKARRAQLLSGAIAPSDIRTAATGDALVSASESVTASLRRTAQLLTEELQVTGGNLSLIDGTTAKLAAATDEYGEQHRKLERSRGLLARIRWQDRKEMVLIGSALAFFAVVVAYIVLRRTTHFVPALPVMLPRSWAAGGPAPVAQPVQGWPGADEPAGRHAQRGETAHGGAGGRDWGPGGASHGRVDSRQPLHDEGASGAGLTAPGNAVLLGDMGHGGEL